MKDVCIVIPTHERAAYLRRCIIYYAKFACRIVICDSSTVGYQEELPQNIHYYHLPGKRFAEKVSFALSLVEEDLVALTPDDDFLFEGALTTGADVLRRNPALRACVGDVLTFPDKPPFRVIGRSAGSAASAGSSGPERNIRTYLANYHQILWSVFRRDTLRLCFESIEQARFENENFFEISIATLCAGKGGIHYLDDYWILREVTEGEHWGRRHAPITTGSVSLMEGDVRKFRHLSDSLLFAGAGDLALSAYLSKDEKKPGYVALISSAKYLVSRGIEKLKGRSSSQVNWETDRRFLPVREAIGF
jgi:glycosyltransferase domain-containing protein